MATKAKTSAKSVKKLSRKSTPLKASAAKAKAKKPSLQTAAARVKAAAPAGKAVTKKLPLTTVETPAAKPLSTKIAPSPVTTLAARANALKPAAPVAVRQGALATQSAGSGRPNSPFAAARPAGNAPQRVIVTTAPKAPLNDNGAVDFKVGDYVVYPAHGVGQVEEIESQTIAGMAVKLYAIRFEKDRMLLKIPVFKARTAGLRKLCSNDRMKDAMKTLQGRARIKRTMWSRRAQEYEMKINSGDPVSIAEVLRDLRRSNDDQEQSYSERQIYQSALERLAREVAAIQKITEIQAAEQLETILRKVA